MNAYNMIIKHYIIIKDIVFG